jgi:hypothetical protein
MPPKAAQHQLLRQALVVSLKKPSTLYFSGSRHFGCSLPLQRTCSGKIDSENSLDKLDNRMVLLVFRSAPNEALLPPVSVLNILSEFWDEVASPPIRGSALILEIHQKLSNEDPSLLINGIKPDLFYVAWKLRLLAPVGDSCRS